jgi:hypothetical protein
LLGRRYVGWIDGTEPHGRTAAGALAPETAMMHVVMMIERRFPEHAGSISRTLGFGSALLLGVGLLMLR